MPQIPGMPLNWDVRDVKNDDFLWGANEIMTPKATALIWSTLVADIGSITEANAEEFYRRLNLYQRNVGRIIGPLLTFTGSPELLTYDDVKSMIGLKTNVSTKTAKQWNKRFKDILFREAVAKVARETKAANAVQF
jgi:hypothetical protein